MKLSKQDQELWEIIETSIKAAERGDVVHQLLMLSLGRVWFKHMKSAPQFLDVPGTEQMMAFHAQLGHIADWIDAAVMNDEPWLKNVDTQGRPKKLMKFSTLDQIVKEADKAMLKAAQTGRGLDLTGSSESLVAELADGFYLVELHTPEALDRESAFMQHCIGQGAYDRHLKDGKHRYLSLRDPAGKAHVTIELFRSPAQVSNKEELSSLVSEEAAPDGHYWTIKQYQGKQNRAPITKYTDILVPYLKDCKFGISDQANGLNYIVDRNLNWHPVSNLPDTLDIAAFIFSGSNYYRDNDRHREKLRLPKTLLNTSHMCLTHAIFEHFPAHSLHNLLLSSCIIDSFDSKALIGENLKVSLINCKLKALPEVIDCLTAALDLRHVEQWPHTIKTKGRAIIRDLDQVSTPIKVNSEHIEIFLTTNQNIDVEHNLVSDGLGVHLSKDADILPRGINVQKLTVGPGNSKNVFIPDGTKVSLKIHIEGLSQIDHIHFPSSIPDRVLLTDGYTMNMHVGEYRRMRRQAAA